MKWFNQSKRSGPRNISDKASLKIQYGWGGWIRTNDHGIKTQRQGNGLY